VGRAELIAGVDTAALAPQPFPEDEMGPSQLWTQLRSAQALDRLAIQIVGGRSLAQHRPAPGLDA
jgi:hypothetical protein